MDFSQELSLYLKLQILNILGHNTTCSMQTKIENTNHSPMEVFRIPTKEMKRKRACSPKATASDIVRMPLSATVLKTPTRPSSSRRSFVEQVMVADTSETWWADEILPMLPRPRRLLWDDQEKDEALKHNGDVIHPDTLKKGRKSVKPKPRWIITSHHEDIELVNTAASNITVPSTKRNARSASGAQFQSIEVEEFDALWDSIEVDVSAITPVPPSSM